MPTMITDQNKRVLGELLDDYKALPWYKKLFYPRALGAALSRYNREAPSLDTVSAIYNAYVNKTWFFQRWFFSSLVSFSRSSLGAELRTLNEARPLTSNELPDEEQPFKPNRLGTLPMELVEKVASNLTQQDVDAWAGSNRQTYSIFGGRNRLLNRILDKFLKCTAYGQQDKAERLLDDVFNGQPEKIQAALQYQGKFTDYSGRTFINCTAYEYAYWAKDTYMCRMLERHMDDETKAYMLARINEIERIDTTTGQPVGLVYSQGGIEHRSAHFDLTPLISALQRYVGGYVNWNRYEREAAWMEVGRAQRDIPVHVLNEYCHPHRSFHPRPKFNEKRLPRNIRFNQYTYDSGEPFFPLVIPDNRGLGGSFHLIGREFGLIRGGFGASAHARNFIDPPRLWHVASDLAAVSHLDEVKNRELTQLHENLWRTDLVHKIRLFFGK
jgi:hypothetical protein